MLVSILLVSVAFPTLLGEAAEPVQAPQRPADSASTEAWPPPGVIRAGKETGVKPPELVKRSHSQYPAEAQRRRIEGKVVMEAVVDTAGNVGEVRVVRSLDKEFGLDDEAVKALKKWKFKPVTKDGVAVPVLIEVTMDYSVRR